MNIVVGSGNSRVVHALPAGSVIAKAQKAEPEQYKALHDNVLSLMIDRGVRFGVRPQAR